MEYTVGTRVFEDWVIIRKLGEGASGQVFEIQKKMGEVVMKSALKVICVPKSEDEIQQVLSEGMDELSVSNYFMQAVETIQKEVRILMELKNSECIVKCEDCRFVKNERGIGGTVLIRMELLTSLRDYQMKHPMKENEVYRMAVELCRGLVYCHEKGLIHRDIKPENIFVSENGQYKLGDFGEARTMEKSTGGLSKKGTDIYMAPEVYLGKTYGKNVDLYSLGLVLYRAMNRNRLPFFPTTGAFSYSEREEALGKRLRGEKLSPPLDASAGFAKIIMRACSYEPKERYQTAGEMLEDLERFGLRKEVDPYPPPPRRNRKCWVALPVFGMAVMLALLLFYMCSLPQKYNVTVKNGTGAGKYQAGETVHIEADDPEDGYRFKEWNVEADEWSLSDKTSPDITFAMPEEGIAVTAKYEKCVYSVTVTNGTGTGEYQAGEEVQIQADNPEEGYEFAGWAADGIEIEFEDKHEACTRFPMPDTDVAVTAEFRKAEVSGKVVVNSGDGDGLYMAGDTVTITADKPTGNREFARWVIESGDVRISDLSKSTISFTMPEGDVVISATFQDMKYHLDVDGGTGSGYYAAGETVNIVGSGGTTAAISNKYEVEWKTYNENGDMIYLEDLGGNSKAIETTILMPANNLKISYDVRMFLTLSDGFAVYVPAPKGWSYDTLYNDYTEFGIVVKNRATVMDDTRFLTTFQLNDPSYLEYLDTTVLASILLENGKTVYYEYEEQDGLGTLDCYEVFENGHVLSGTVIAKLYKVKEEFGNEEELVKLLFENVEKKS